MFNSTKEKKENYLILLTKVVAMSFSRRMAREVSFCVPFNLANFTVEPVLVHPNMMLSRTKMLEPLNSSGCGDVAVTTMPR